MMFIFLIFIGGAIGAIIGALTGGPNAAIMGGIVGVGVACVVFILVRMGTATDAHDDDGIVDSLPDTDLDGIPDVIDDD